MEERQSAGPELLEVSHLSVSFFTPRGEVQAVRDVSFSLRPGEVLAIAPSSIGRQLHDAKTSLEMVDLFAWTGFIILLSVALERGMVALLARIFPGKEGS